MRGRKKYLSCIVALIVCSGCGNSGGDENGTHEPVVCDPLQRSEPASITLGRVLAAGKDADGTVYVLDEDEAHPGEQRVFVSQDGTLYRQDVKGSGTGIDSGVTWYSVSVDDGAGGFTLYVVVDSTGNVSMGVLDGQQADRGGATIPADARVLETMTADALDMPVKDLPSGDVIEYLAQADTGERLLVTRPWVDWSYADFRAFYGMPEDVLERDVIRVERAKDGGSTHVIFELRSGEADAFFPIVFDGTTFLPGDATLTIDGVAHPLERLQSDPSLLDSMTIRCTQ